MRLLKDYPALAMRARMVPAAAVAYACDRREGTR